MLFGKKHVRRWKNNVNVQFKTKIRGQFFLLLGYYLTVPPSRVKMSKKMDRWRVPKRLFQTISQRVITKNAEEFSLSAAETVYVRMYISF